MEIIQEQAINIFTTVVIALMGLASAYAMLYIAKAKAKINADLNKITDENVRNLSKNMVNDVFDLVKDSVLATNETTVKGLQLATADGKVSREELEQIGKDLKTKIVASLPDKTVDIINSNVMDINKLVEMQIEKALLEIKAETEKIESSIK